MCNMKIQTVDKCTLPKTYCPASFLINTFKVPDPYCLHLMAFLIDITLWS